LREFSEDNLTEAVLESLEKCDNPRLLQIMQSIIKHLHGIVRDVEPTPEEWFAAIQFLTQTGQKCDDVRQEFILLSDTLGISMLVDAINNRKPDGATQTSVLGPFYTEGAPEFDLGADLAPGEEPGVTVSGTVTSVEGKPLAGALLDIWQTDPNGLYHMQDPEQEEHHLCGKISTDTDGGFTFRTLKPVSYPIPTDGPVGALLAKLGRHPFRPAHIHFIVSAPGFERITTQLFIEGDEYLESDAVFGVKDSLVVNYKSEDASLALSYDFVLASSDTGN